MHEPCGINGNIKIVRQVRRSLRKEPSGKLKTARSFAAYLVALYFEKSKKIHFLEIGMPCTLSEKTCSQLQTRLKPIGIPPKPVPAYPQKPVLSSRRCWL